MIKKEYKSKVKLRTKILCFCVITIILIGIVGVLFYNGILLFNNPSKERYPIRGVDVSAYQGDIEWEVLAKQGIEFAFIKATEGSTFVDKKFKTNFDDAIKTNLRIGAYHFFSFDSSGEAQAKNFCNTVPKEENLLPPVVDIEFYGDKAKNPPDSQVTKKELNKLLMMLEEYYNKKPIIYATKQSYDLYISNDFENYDIWIRDVFTNPSLSDGRKWTFWQYTNREKLKGYEGVEKYIDMNVYYGTKEEFLEY